MTPDAGLLRDYPGDLVRVVCVPCGREGRDRLARLISLFGPDAGLCAALASLSAGCPHRQDWRQAGPCQAFFPDLVAAGRMAQGRAAPAA